MKTPITFLLCCLSMISFSQETSTHSEEHTTTSFPFSCGHNREQEEYFKAHPEKRKVYEAQQEIFQQKYERKIANSSRQKTETEKLIIPTVIHIVHQNGAENISDAQAISAIAQLNLDFSGENANIDDVVPDFENIVGNPNIEFRLAQIDPQGNCHDGITRTVSGGTNDNGPLALRDVITQNGTWPQNQYMNIIVCRDVGAGLGGYTNYPTNFFNQNGMGGSIYVRSNYMGTIETARTRNDHVLSHEVGHWLNLAHTWGNSNFPELATNCDDDDGVADTPNTTGGGCQLTRNTCGSLDNVQNFMDYSFCFNMFTEGQATRIRTALESSTAGRNKLWNNEAPYFNLTRTGVADEGGLCEVSFSANNTSVCPGEDVQFSLNSSTSKLSNILWTFEGGTPSTSSELSPIVSYGSAGNYRVSIEVSDAVYTVSSKRNNYINIKNGGVCGLEILSNKTDICTGSEVTYSFDAPYDDPDNISWTFEGGTPSTSTLLNPVVTYNSSGDFDVRVDLTKNSNTISTLSNDYIHVFSNDETLPLPYSESFENISTPSEDNRMFTASTNEMDFEIFSGNTGTGNNGANCVKVSSFNVADESKYTLISPVIDLSSLTILDKVIFNFKYAFMHKISDDYNNARLKVFISNDCGDTWVLKRQLIDGKFGIGGQINNFTPSLVEDWIKIGVPDIVPDFFVEGFRYKFEFSFDGDVNNLYIDDINLTSYNTMDISEGMSKANWRVYPNPANDELNIDVQNSVESDLTIGVYNMLGQKVINSFEIESGTQNTTIDVSEFQSGIYILRLVHEGIIEEKRIVKN